MKSNGYIQCELQRETEEGVVKKVAFIEKRFAKPGRRVRVRLEDGWSDYWTVVEAYQSVEKPPDVQSSVRQHKRRTGDSSRKRKR